jgi:hypothetical protein
MAPKKGAPVAAAVAEASDDVDAAGSSDGASSAAAKRASSTEDSLPDPPSPTKKARAVPGGGRPVSYNTAKAVWSRVAMHYVSSDLHGTVLIFVSQLTLADCMHFTVDF